MKEQNKDTRRRAEDQEKQRGQKGPAPFCDAEVLRDPDAQYVYDRQGEYTVEDYYALPDEQRVELIDGVLYDMAAPGFDHQTVTAQIFRQLDAFIDGNGGSCIPFISPVDVQLDCDDRTMVQPDVVLLCDMQKAIGRCIYGAPDLVVEVLSPSTAWKDRNIKLKKYRNAGVREYWMIDLQQEKVIVYDFEHNNLPVIYGMDQPIPVQIYDGRCQIWFDTYFARMKMLYGNENPQAAV